jgi:hypothetical protein
MNTNKTTDRWKRSRSTKLISAMAISVALATVGYGIVEVAAQFAQAPTEVAASVVPQGTMMNSEPQPAVLDPLRPTSGLHRVVTSDERIENPRECVREKGITDACTFN